MPLKILLFLSILFVGSSLHAKENPRIVIPKTTAPAIYTPLTFEEAINGATFKASGHNIRIWGIEVPSEKDLYYKESTMVLRAFLEEAQLECKPIDINAVFGDIRHCSVNGKDLGSLMVKTGWAKDFPKYSDGFYKDDEDFARQEKLGIWE